MAKNKYYAVQRGRVPGVYSSWDEAKAQIDGFAGAVYKGFSTHEEAKAFLGKDGYESKEKPVQPKVPTGAFAFVDGSFNPNMNITGFGGVLFGPVREDGTRDREVLMGKSTDVNYTKQRNVGGEMLGALEAVRRAISNGYESIVLFYDYEGIRAWATGAWKANYESTRHYQQEMAAFKDRIAVRFEHVKAHTGVKGNELADKLAKKSVGIEF